MADCGSGLDRPLRVADRLDVLARMEQRPGEVRVRLRAARSVTDPLELFDRAEVAGDGFVEASAIELDHRQVAEAVPDLLDTPGGFGELEAAAEHVRRLVEAAAHSMRVAEQAESHRNT